MKVWKKQYHGIKKNKILYKTKLQFFYAHDKFMIWNIVIIFKISTLNKILVDLLFTNFVVILNFNNPILNQYYLLDFCYL